MRLRPLLCFVLVLVGLPALATATVTVSPSMVTLRPSEATPFISVQLAFSTQANPGMGNLEITPPSALIGSISLDPDPVSYSWGSGTATSSTQFRLITSSATPPGTYSFVVADDTLDAGSTTFTLRILEPVAPTFSGRITPAAVNVVVGGSGAPVTVETLPGTGFDESVRWQITGFPGFVNSGGAQTSSAPAFPDLVFGLSAGHSAAPGTYSGTVQGTATGAPTVSLPLTVVVAAADFTPRVSPNRVSLTAGGRGATVSVNTSATGLESGSVRYSLVGLPAGVTAGGPQLTRAPAFEPVEFLLNASAGATPGVSRPRVRGVFRPGDVVREVPFTLEVERTLPQIVGLQPARVVAGGLGQRLIVIGRDFEPGARIEVSAAGVRLGATSFIDSGRLETEIDVRGDVPAGTVRVNVINPDGATSASPRLLSVVGAGSLGAPLTVQTAAVLYPAPGATLAGGERVFPRGVLAVSGSGPLVVTWRLDGMPFERSVVQARGGEPVAVAARMPIPESTLGQHLLQLVVEGRNELASEPVAVLQVSARESRLRLLRPRAGRVVQSSRPPLLTWTQVPGSSGYVVEVVGQRDRVVRRWPAAQARWRAPSGDLARLAGGAYRWRVRPVFAGGVVGEALEPRLFALLPQSVDLVAAVNRQPDGGLEITWRGGALGALYRVDCVDAAGEIVFSALSARPEYRLPTALPEPEGFWRVSALAPDGSVLGQSVLASAPQAALRGEGRYRLAAESEVSLTAQSPSEGGAVTTSRPEISVRWDNAIDVEEVFLMVDSTDVTSVATTDPVSVSYVPLLPLEPGSHRVTLGVGDRVFEWEFEVALGGEAGDASESVEAAPEEWLDDDADWVDDVGDDAGWQVDLEVTGTFLDGDDLASSESEIYGTLTLFGEERGARAYVQASADVSARKAIAPDDVFEEQNRSWIAEVGHERGAISQELMIGYAAPAFLSGSELLTAGLPKGGAQARLGAGPLTVSYYQAFDPDLEGVVTGISGAEQELRAAAFELGSEGGSQLRLVGLEVEEKPDGFFAGGEGSLYGLFGIWHFGAASSLTVELAHGDFTPAPASLEAPGDGDAARLGLTAIKGDWTLDLSLRYVEEEFINPTNRGLAVGGIPDRQGADLRLGRSWDGGGIDIGLRRYEGGTGSGPGALDSSLSAGDLSLYQQLGANSDVTLTAGYNLSESDGNAAIALPASEQADWNVALALSQRVGAWTFGQDVSASESDDRLDPSFFSDSAQAGLSLQRAGERFQLFSHLSALRTRVGIAQDTTESLLATLQPTWQWIESGFSLTPYGSYSRVEDDFSLEPTVSETYRLALSWSPSRLAWLSALQLSSEWSRTQGALALSDDFVARYTASLSIGWGSGRRALRPAADPPPIAGALLPADSVIDL